MNNCTDSERLQDGSETLDFVFNHDGFGILHQLVDTPMTEQDAADVLVAPLAGTDITIIDWCIMTTGEHNCRTRHGRLFDGVGQDRPIDRELGRIMQRYAAGPRDLLDIVVAHGHDAGMRVFGCVRLNHALNPDRLQTCPGRTNPANAARKDFRDEDFHAYLAELYEDLLEKNVDGLTLDFERKAPFFPDDAPRAERFQACESFVRRIRRLTSLPIAARVSYEREKGEPQGQDPEKWVREGLLDAVAPATHNHEPDRFDWSCGRFLAAARESPRPCRVWPQLWPAYTPWRDRRGNCHDGEAVVRRVRELLQAGSDGAYFFNFCCADEPTDHDTEYVPRYVPAFRRLRNAGVPR